MYDSLGRPIGCDFEHDSARSGNELWTRYGFDDYGRFGVLSWCVPAMSGGTAVYDRVAGSDLIGGYTVTNASGTNTFRFGRDYEPGRDQITAVWNTLAGTEVSRYAYSNNAVGHRVNVTNSGSAFTAPNGFGYGYNGRGELTNALGQSGSTTNAFAYAYDPIGNRTASASNALAWAYLANALNQYTNVTGGATNALLYDLDGNLTNDSVWAYTWDGENRLLKVEPAPVAVNAKRMQCVYDHRGRRVRRWVELWGGSAWSATLAENNRTYLYDGWNMLAEIKAGPTTFTNYCVWGPDLSGSTEGAGGIGRLVWAGRRGNQAGGRVYCYDANGNVGQVLTNGAVEIRYEYDPYGQPIVAAGTAGVNLFKFSTKYHDQPFNLYYYGYRYYAPGIGRWLSMDPIGERGGMNRYSLVGNTPINIVDYLGTKKVTLVREEPSSCDDCPCEKDKTDCALTIQFLEPGDQLDIISKGTVKKTWKFDCMTKVTFGKKLDTQTPVIIRITSKTGKNVSKCNLHQDVLERWRQDSVGGLWPLPPGKSYPHLDYSSSDWPGNLGYGRWWLYDAPSTSEVLTKDGDVFFRREFWQAKVSIEEAPSIVAYWGWMWNATKTLAGPTTSFGIDKSVFGFLGDKKVNPYLPSSTP